MGLMARHNLQKSETEDIHLALQIAFDTGPVADQSGREF
jgi:hypothetical protein